MCEIAMLIFGIIALVRGHFLLTRVKEVRGWPARIIGILLILPFPLSFFVGILLGAIFLEMGKGIDEQGFKSAAQIAGFVIVALCFLLAIAVAMVYAQPIRKKRSEQEEVAVDEDYDERFQARTRAIPESQDITGKPSPPSILPEDRIQP